MLGWENPLWILAEAAGTVLGRVVLFFLACWLGCSAAVLAMNVAPPLGYSPFVFPVYWLGAAPLGMADGWGVLPYVVLFGIFCNVIVRDATPVWPFVVATFVQFFETARMLQFRGKLSVWLAVLLFALLVAAVVGLVKLARRSQEQRNRRRYRRNMGLCVQCGYDVRASVLAGSRACPECGTEVPTYTVGVIKSSPPPAGVAT